MTLNKETDPKTYQVPFFFFFKRRWELLFVSVLSLNLKIYVLHNCYITSGISEVLVCGLLLRNYDVGNWVFLLTLIHFFIIKGFQVIVFIIIVISTTAGHMA